MDRYRLEYQWEFAENRWHTIFYINGEECELSSVEELEKYVQMPFSGEIEGDVRMQSEALPEGEYDVTFPAVTVYDEKAGRWKAAAEPSGGSLPSFGKAAAMLLALSGQTFPSEMLPALPSASMNGVYETESKEDPSRLEASLTAEGTWTLFGNFKIGHPGLHICDRGPYGSFGILGSVFIGTKELAFLLAYSGGRLCISADKLPAELPSLGDFGGLFGLKLDELLPDEILALGGLKLERLLLLLPAGLWPLDRLEFSVTMIGTFRLMGIESLTLSEIGFDFDGYAVGGKGGGESLQIRGKLSYEEEDLYLSALKYGEGNSWRFSGVFYNGKEFGLMSLWNLLSVGEAPDILKAIGVPVYTVSVDYDMGQNHFAVRAWFRNDNELFLEADGRERPVTFRAGVSLAPEIRLSSLPVIGESMHALDGLFLNDISLLYQTGTGVTLRGSLNAPMRQLPFTLHLCKPAGTESACEGLWETADEKVNQVAYEDADTICWLKADLTLGPLELVRIGIGYEKDRLSFMVDTAVCCKMMAIRFLGLGFSMDLSDFRNLSFSLKGMELSINTSSFSLGGSFMKTSDRPLEFDGSLLLRAGDLSLTVIGSYTETEGSPSVFAYGVLRKMLGGPPAFYVTGVAAGFGYQRGLLLPDIGQVAEFPLIRMVYEEGNEAELIRTLKERYMKISGEEMWLAAGIRFTSFEMVKSFAILTVSVGNHLEIALLGLGQMTLGTIAKAELSLKAVICPEEGIFSLRAALTNESYLFSPDCHLTGGFAFYVWYGGVHKGDFVLTLGGYHNGFERPSHYPEVERLGFSWMVNRNLSFSGGLYFALTPSCIMAGGGIDARYANGNLSAWFYARADFLMYWKPFYYQIGIAAGIGASYRVDCLFVHHTFTLELSAALSLWGPEFTGKMKVKWWIISFTIKFGSGNSGIKYLTFEEFLEQCVPGDAKQGKTGSPDCGSGKNYATVTVSDGLIEETKDSEKMPVSLVRGEGFKLSIHTQVPNAAFHINSKPPCRGGNESLFILPMGGVPLSCETVVTVKKQDRAGVWKPVKHDTFLVEEQYENIPAALWGKELSCDGSMIEHALTGVLLTPKETEVYVFPDSPVDLDRMAEEEAVLKDWCFCRPVYRVKEEEDKELSNQEFSKTAMADAAVEDRRKLLLWLNDRGMELEGDGRIGSLAENAENLFTEQITFCRDIAVYGEE